MTELDEAMDDLRDAIRSEVRKGYTPADEIVEVALDVSDDGEEGTRERLRPAAEDILRAEAEALRREQAAWPAVTDCDRLDEAFAALEDRGIVARQDFTCCMTCGSTEIWAEVEDAMAEGTAARGYTFFHQQDSDSAVEGGGLYLAYGSMEEGGGAAIGREIVQVLGAHGFAPEWDGSVETRIRVPLDWKRRRDDL